METNWKYSAHGVQHTLDVGANGDRPGGGFGRDSSLVARPATVQCGELELYRPSRSARLAGAELTLTDREYEVLFCLTEHAYRVVRRIDLLEQVWGVSDDDGSNLVAVYMGRIRRKLGEHARMITTIRSVGYRLRPAQDG
jgi:DNA-binding response OmpR family regulator